MSIANKIEFRNILSRMIADTEYRLEELREKLIQVDQEIFELELVEFENIGNIL